MDKQTQIALEKSITKWRKIAAGEEREMGCDNCQLCHLFADEFCDGCPVHAATEEPDCRGTPYAAWVRHQDRAHDAAWLRIDGRMAECPICSRLALREARFLESLRDLD